jgi:hypothetical protein
MKKILISLCIFGAITSTINAQIPNSGFEDWTSFGNGMTINGWWCSNDSINPNSDYFPVTRSSDHYPSAVGSYCIRLECTPALPTWTGFGLAWPGDYEGGERPSFPITGHPLALCGYYKYFPQNGDMMNIRWILYKNGGVVDGGELLSGTLTAEWTSFEIPLSDNTYLSADSARITISPFDWNGPMLGNSVLYVDNLSFDNLITSVPEQSIKSMEINVFPNPAYNSIMVSAKWKGLLKLKILDASGKKVLINNEAIPADGSVISVSLTMLKPGLYLLIFQDENGIISTKQFIKK